MTPIDPIIGTCISGLSAAIYLRKAIWNVRVFGRGAAVRELGFTLLVARTRWRCWSWASSTWCCLAGRADAGPRRRTCRTSLRASTSRAGPRSITTLGSTSSSPASPTPTGVPTHEEFSQNVLDRTIGDLATASGFARYLAYRDGAVAGGAGGGSLRLHEGAAQLCGAATAPTHHRRGVQTALLATRLADAARQDCDIAVVTTQPGSKSQQNVSAAGLELLYTRAILVQES